MSGNLWAGFLRILDSTQPHSRLLQLSVVRFAIRSLRESKLRVGGWVGGWGDEFQWGDGWVR